MTTFKCDLSPKIRESKDYLVNKRGCANGQSGSIESDPKAIVKGGDECSETTLSSQILTAGGDQLVKIL